MSKSTFDEAYESEAKRYPPFFRMTPLNLKILIGFVAVYSIACIALGFISMIAAKKAMEALDAYGSSSSMFSSMTSRMPGMVLFYAVVSVIINIAIFIFVVNSLLGNIGDQFQAYCMVAIPIWTVAILIWFRTIANLAFIVPLAWLEIMIIVEKRIHTAAQRRANTLSELEREHKKRNPYDLSDIQDIPEPSYAPIKGRDARYCPVCGIELGPDDKECPMCGPAQQ